MNSLYRMTSELMLLEKLTEENTEELEVLVSQADIIELIKSKTDNCADYHRYLNDRIEAAKTRQKQLKEIIEADEKKIAKLEEYFKLCLNVLEVKELKGNDSSIKLKKNPPKCNILDENLIGIQYITTKIVETVTIDKKRILEDLKAGVIVEGVEMVQESRLEIK